MKPYKKLFKEDLFSDWKKITTPIKDLDLYSTDKNYKSEYEVGFINKNKDKYNKRDFGAKQFSDLFNKQVIKVEYYNDGTIFLTIKK